MADHALQTARSLLVTAGKAGPGSREHRDFFSHLITLPTYRDSQCTQFFSTLVSRYFSEFEDLQDRAVDAVLDLCEDEDEQTRIIGIKGLGATAKADPRWVRGNAGVLLQLLECPERELREVKTVLNFLLAKSPIEVLSVMADDCKGSEEETGASRRNILEYLLKDCAEFRRTTLESGRNLAAEQVFRAGFTDVLKQTAINETRMVLEMLIPLSMISGPSAKVEATNAFVKALTDSLKADSSTSVTTGHIHLLANLAKLTNLTPRSALYFFGKHGGAVVESILEKKDEVALALVKGLKVWAEEAIKGWKKEDTKRDEGLVRDCVLAMIEELLDCVEDISSSKLISISPVLEHLLLPLYALIRYRDRRKDILNSRKSKDIEALGHTANKAAKEYHRRSTEGRCIRNIREMAEIMSDSDLDFTDIQPSWTPRQASPPPKPSIPVSRNTVPSGPRPTAPTATASSSKATFPTPIQSSSIPRPPSGPRSTSPIRPPPSAPRVKAEVIDLTTGGAFDRPGSSRIEPDSSRTSISARNGGQRDHTTTTYSPAAEKKVVTPPRESAKKGSVPPESPRVATPPPPTPNRKKPIPITSGLSIKGKEKIDSKPDGDSSRGVELLGAPSVNVNGSSRGIEVLSLPTPAQPSHAPVPSSFTSNPANPSASDTPPSNSSTSVPARSTDNASAAVIGGRSIYIKRQREETSESIPVTSIPSQVDVSASTSNPTASLASRLGFRDEPGGYKRSRRDENGHTDTLPVPKPSLADRINNKLPPAASTSTQPIPQDIPIQAVQAGLMSRNEASPAPSLAGMTIRRSFPAPSPTTMLPASLSVLGRSTTSAPAPTPGFSIAGRSTSSSALSATPTLAPEDVGPIRRKGRGFQSEDYPMRDIPNHGGFVQPASTPPAAAPVPVFTPAPVQNPIPITGRFNVPGRGSVQPFRPAPKPPTEEPVSRGSLLSRMGPRG